MVNTIEGHLTDSRGSYAIVASRFNSFIVDQLLKGAVDALVRHGVAEKQITVAHVPGAFEIPLICKKLAESNRFDGIIAVGAVIRGATSHYDLVCSSVVGGISKVMLDSGVPIALGVVTADTIEQAIERSGSKAGNKGMDAAIAAIEMVSVTRRLKEGSLT